MRTLPLLLLLCLLTACAAGPREVERAAPSISYRYDRYNGDELARVRQRAESYCAGFSRQAKLVDTARRGGEDIATFECR